MLGIDIKSVAFLLKDDDVSLRAVVISLQPQVGIRGDGMRPSAQNIAAGNIKLIMHDPGKISRIAWINSAEDLVHSAPVSVSLDRYQVLIRDIPIGAKTPATQLPGIIGGCAIGKHR